MHQVSLSQFHACITPLSLSLQSIYSKELETVASSAAASQMDHCNGIADASPSHFETIRSVPHHSPEIATPKWKKVLFVLRHFTLVKPLLVSDTVQWFLYRAHRSYPNCTDVSRLMLDHIRCLHLLLFSLLPDPLDHRQLSHLFPQFSRVHDGAQALLSVQGFGSKYFLPSFLTSFLPVLNKFFTLLCNQLYARMYFN